MFKTGQRLNEIYYKDPAERIRVGCENVKSITVTKSSVLLPEVQWARVIYEDGKEFMYSLALCDGVQIK